MNWEAFTITLLATATLISFSVACWYLPTAYVKALFILSALLLAFAVGLGV